jgi:hypothetical protein
VFVFEEEIKHTYNGIKGSFEFMRETIDHSLLEGINLLFKKCILCLVRGLVMGPGVMVHYWLTGVLIGLVRNLILERILVRVVGASRLHFFARHRLQRFIVLYHRKTHLVLLKLQRNPHL